MKFFHETRVCAYLLTVACVTSGFNTHRDVIALLMKAYVDEFLVFKLSELLRENHSFCAL